MVARKVITYVCDICPAEAESESTSWKTPLPLGWVDLNVVNNYGVVHSKHLCPDCYKVVSSAITRRENAVAKKAK